MSRETRSVPIGLIFAFFLASCALAQPGAAPTPVIVAPIEQRDLPASISLVGTVLPLRSAVIASEVSGLVVGMEAIEGRSVRAGDMLVQLDPAVLTLRLDEARARLDELSASLEMLENGTRAEELDRLAAAVAEAEAIAERWRFETERLANLPQQALAPKERHDAAMELVAAQRRLAQDQARLTQAKNGARREELAIARATVAAQKAVVGRLARDLELTHVRAPFDGLVLMRRTELGQWIEPGGPVCELVAVDVVKIRVDVPEFAVRFSGPGQPATIEIEALGETFTAEIARVIPQANPAARTFPVEIDLPNPQRRLLPGMFVRAQVPRGPSGPRLLAPRDAIVLQGLNKQVWVVRSVGDGPPMAMPVPVTTGLQAGTLVEVIGEGLQAGDQVVVRANERLFMPGPVAPTPMSGAAPESGAMTGRPPETR